MFKSIVFHLPDNQNLMHLKVKDKYIFKLENAIRYQAKHLIKKNLELQVIGDNFDNKVRECINKLLKEKVIDVSQIHIRKHLVSRAGQVNQIADIKMDKARKVDKKKNDLYYCSYGRLKKGVMIPDGSLALCCCDYSLEHISGSLIKENLNEIYNHNLIFFNSHNENNSFLRGSFNPCRRCEMYKRL